MGSHMYALYLQLYIYSSHNCITHANTYRFPTPDLREGVAVKMYSQPKLRQEVCYADISSLLFKTCLSDSKLTKYEVELKTLRGNEMNLVIYKICINTWCECVCVC